VLQWAVNHGELPRPEVGRWVMGTCLPWSTFARELKPSMTKPRSPPTVSPVPPAKAHRTISAAQAQQL
jgi:hypothetical protein